MNPKSILRKVDGVQRSRTWVAFPFAVVKKFGDDRAGYLAALIAYYGFFSLFPLLLVLVNVLGFLLRGNPDLRQSVLDSALAQFPVIGEQLRQNIDSLSGSGVAVVIGTVTALWAGLAVTRAAQNAMNEVWSVPIKERPNFLAARARSLIMLVVLGTITVGAMVFSGLGTATGTLGIVLRGLGMAGSLLLNLCLFLLAYRVLTERDLTWGDVLPGSIFAAVVWTTLQALGNFYVARQIKNATPVYGTFALVIGLLVWIYLGAQITLYGAEINVVRKRRLWPRSLVTEDLSHADERTYRSTAKVEERVPQEAVDATFDGGSDAAGPTLAGKASPGEAPRPRRGGPGRDGRGTAGVLRSVIAGAVGSVVIGAAVRARNRLRRPRRPRY